MLATKDVELARETVRDLYDRGQVERARAIEAVLAQALAASASTAHIPTEYLTPSKAARMLSVGPWVVEDWITTGQLPAVRLRGRLRVSRAALESHLHRLRERQERETAPTPVEEAAARQQHEFIVTGLPPDKVARLEQLIDKVQDGQRVSRREREELAGLEREVAALAGGRLGEWIQQTARRATTP